MSRLLIVDDNPALREQYAYDLARLGGHEVLQAADGAEGLRVLETEPVDCVVLDLEMPGIDGFGVLRGLREKEIDVPVVVYTGTGDFDRCIRAVRLGAYGFVDKDEPVERVAQEIANALEHGRLAAEVASLRRRLGDGSGMIGDSTAMDDLRARIAKVAPIPSPVLVLGESGSGKELVARALHKLGPRRERRFVTFNCSAIVETLFESELFGHTRGAFTGAVEAKAGLFELADGGTLFLDEVGELPLPVQAKLLRVLENGEVQRVGATEGRRVDVRVIAATNRRLVDEVATGRFRQDLYYRLNVVEIGLSPLRKRREDIVYITAAATREFAERFRKPVSGLSPGAERLLYNAPWPGNIRELRNVLERACMLSEGRILSEREVLAALGGGQRTAHAAVASTASDTAKSPEPLPELDRKTIEQALQQAGGNRSAAAKRLGVSRRALYRRLDAFGLR